MIREAGPSIGDIIAENRTGPRIFQETWSQCQGRDRSRSENSRDRSRSERGRTKEKRSGSKENKKEYRNCIGCKCVDCEKMRKNTKGLNVNWCKEFKL